MPHVEERQSASLRALNLSFQSKFEATARVSPIGPRTTAGEPPNTQSYTTGSDAVKEHQNEETQQNIAHTEHTIQDLVAEIQMMKSKLDELLQYQCQDEYPHYCNAFFKPSLSSECPFLDSSVVSTRPTLFSNSSARLLFPQVDTIATTLTHQRAQLTATRALVAAEWATPASSSPGPFPLDRKIHQLHQKHTQELEAAHQTAQRLHTALNAEKSRVQALTTELKQLQTKLGEAQWGVLQYADKCKHFMDKSQTQRRQLCEVQTANGNVRRENKRLRAEVKEWRESRYWVATGGRAARGSSASLSATGVISPPKPESEIVKVDEEGEEYGLLAASQIPCERDGGVAFVSDPSTVQNVKVPRKAKPAGRPVPQPRLR